MNDPLPIQPPVQTVRSGAIGRVGLIFCATAVLTLGLLALLKPG
ncbi:MAG TPA: hypothetical protein VJA21_06690 [Verrucomicrobiae bacterium]